jgi:hypothetical protein
MTAHQLHVSYRRNVTLHPRRQRPTPEAAAGVKVTIVDVANAIATALDAGHASHLANRDGPTAKRRVV